ncbi:MAG TPA: PPC domain-containing protein, partial [Candidatus Limnocylindrales bacterium]|nr:PPC domain-containing protein [Candidatus Limnocylindrales bacterium]
MMNNRTRWWALLALIAVVLVALPVLGQASAVTVLQSGVPQSGALDAATPTQAFVYEASVVPQFNVTVTSDFSAVLGVVVTDDTGAVIGVDTGVDNLIRVLGPAVTEPASFTITIFNTGPELTGEVPFDVRVDVPQIQQPPSATPAPEATAETDATVVPEAASQVVLNQGMSVTLSWATTDDFDLEVRDPVGGSLYWETPTVESGGTITRNANQQCVNTVTNPSETATWSAGGVPTGSYEILVYFQSSCNDDAEASFRVDVNVDGVALPPIEGTTSPGDVFAVAFEIAADGSAELMTAGSAVNVNDMPAPASQILAGATPIAVGDTVTGVLTNQQYFQAYSFEASADVLYSITLEAVSGSLDTLVQVLDSQGRLVRVNDDREFGVTDSSLEGVLLPSAGTYTIVATRYAKSTGGTEGEYALTLSESASGLPADFSASLVPGSLQVLLVWNTPADLQLLVRDPSGDAVFDDVPQIASGGRLAAAGNVQCRTSDAAPFSYIYWPPE